MPLSTRIPICRSMRSPTSRGDKFTGRAGSSQGSSVHQIFLTVFPMAATTPKLCVYWHNYWMFRKYDLSFFASCVDIFNRVIVPNRAQGTYHKAMHAYFYIVYWVHYDEVKKSYVKLKNSLIYNLCLCHLHSFYMFRSYYLNIFRELTPTFLENIQQRNWSLQKYVCCGTKSTEFFKFG